MLNLLRASRLISRISYRASFSIEEENKYRPFISRISYRVLFSRRRGKNNYPRREGQRAKSGLVAAINIVYSPIAAAVRSRASKNDEDDVIVALLGFNSSRSRGGLSRLGLETTRRCLAEQLSTSGSAWPSGRSDHRSCLIVSIARIAAISPCYALIHYARPSAVEIE
jgi:hypothetical protein